MIVTRSTWQHMPVMCSTWEHMTAYDSDAQHMTAYDSDAQHMTAYDSDAQRLPYLTSRVLRIGWKPPARLHYFPGWKLQMVIVKHQRCMGWDAMSPFHETRDTQSFVAKYIQLYYLGLGWHWYQYWYPLTDLFRVSSSLCQNYRRVLSRWLFRRKLFYQPWLKNYTFTEFANGKLCFVEYRYETCGSEP